MAVAFVAGCGEIEPRETESAPTDVVAEAAQPEVEEYEVDVMDDDRSVERRIEDASLEARVRIALVESKPLRPFNFQPEAVNGRVVLRGEVSSDELRQQAASVAGGVEGVREVVNELSAAGEPPIAAATDAGTRDPAVQQPEKPEPEEAEPDKTELEKPAAATSDSPAAKAPEKPAETEKPKAAETEKPEIAETKPPSSRPNWVIRGVWREPRPTTPAAPEPAKEEAAEPEGQFHTVRSGDNLWTISRRYGVTTDDIKRLNNLRSNTLRPGQKLRVK